MEWISEKGKFKKEYEATERKTIKEIENAFVNLHKLLDKQKLTKQAVVQEGISSIENVLEFQDGHIFAMPPYYEIAYDRFKNLCYRLLELGHNDIVKKFGELIAINKPLVDPKSQAISVVSEWHVHYFTFNPSRSKLFDLGKVFTWDEVAFSWAVWEYLALAEWCWDMPFTFFEERELEYVNAETCAQSRFLLNLHGFWTEMNALKNGNNQINILFFDRKRFTNYLKTLLNVVLLHQEIHGAMPQQSLRPSPYSIELKLNDGKLTLDVEWFQDGTKDTYLIHKFNEESDYHTFTRKLLNSAPETSICIEDFTKGATIPKFLERTKLKGVFSDIFFSQKSTHKLAKRSNRIILTDQSQSDLHCLRESIKCLPKIRGYPFYI